MVARHKETSRWGGADEQLLRELLAPPALDDGIRSLDYWRQRARQLPWYRVRARSEATRMTARWERRVGAALVSERHAPLEARVYAGVLLWQARLGRWTRRGRRAVLAVLSTILVVVAVPAVVAVVYLLNAL